MPSKSSQPLVSLVIPCGKEPHRIVTALLDMDAYFSKQSFAYELLVVFYSSDIHTRDIVHRMGSLIPHMRTMEVKSGVGSAIQRGMLDAHGLMRIYVPPLLAQHVQLYQTTESFFRKGYDVVSGSYYASEVTTKPPLPWDRFYQWFIRLLFRFSPRDSGSGWVAYSQKAAVRIFPLTTAHSDVIIGESLALARYENMRVKELPITASVRPRISFWSYMRKVFESVGIFIHFFVSGRASRKRM